MLKRRISMGMVLAFAFCSSLWYDAVYGKSIGFTLFLVLGTFMVLREFYRMVRAKGAKPMVWWGITMGICLVFAHNRWCWEKWHDATRTVPDIMNLMLAICVLGTCAIQGFRKKPDGAILNIGATLMGLVYVWFLPSFLAKMRHLGIPGGHGWELDGVEFIIITIFASKICDVGGLFVGKRYGRHKLSPIVSPNKTWEGAAGGVLASVCLVVFMRYTSPESVLGAMGILPVICFGVLMAVSGLLGDLLESAMKRDSEMKDAGGSIPGFGGMMDIADSIMVSGPAAYFFFVLMGARPGL